jgi:hypothetical protein
MFFKFFLKNYMAKFNFKNELMKVGLNSDNAVVIGSGILDALNLRESADIDIIVKEEKYKEMAESHRFKKKKKRGKELIVDDLFEIGTSWTVIGKNWEFNDLLNQSIVIDDVRYNTIDFLLDVKCYWVANKDARQKDIDDVKLIEQHKNKQIKD